MGDRSPVQKNLIVALMAVRILYEIPYRLGLAMLYFREYGIFRPIFRSLKISVPRAGVSVLGPTSCLIDTQIIVVIVMEPTGLQYKLIAITRLVAVD
jgi:hypothetical protein